MGSKKEGKGNDWNFTQGVFLLLGLYAPNPPNSFHSERVNHLTLQTRIATQASVEREFSALSHFF